MQRVTITLDDDLMAELDRLIEMKGYQNRSEAMRDLVRAGIREEAIESASTESCVAALVYVYDHSARELSKRLVRSFHDHHDLSLATMHIHLDHESCLEITVMRGATAAVRHMAEHVVAERGVRHGRLIMIPVEVQSQAHPHGERPAGRHTHIRVR